MTVPDDVAALIAAEQADWGQWRARVPIFIDNVRAFNEGHAVPNSHVKRFGWDKTGEVEPINAPADATTTDDVVHPQGDDIVVNVPPAKKTAS